VKGEFVKVRVRMKDGNLYEGIKGGSEGGLLYLFKPEKLEKDETGKMEGYFHQQLSDTFALIPIVDIEIILERDEYIG
jgi:hypothetical protein